jgi:hypothetical protein
VKRAGSAAVVATALLFVSAAARADAIAVDQLPGAAVKLPAATGTVKIPSVVVRRADGSQAAEVAVDTRKPVCIVQTDVLDLGDGQTMEQSWPMANMTGASPFLVQRIIERKDGTHAFEESRVRIDSDALTLTLEARATTPLAEVARTPEGVVVYAFRRGNAAFIVTATREGATSRAGWSAIDEKLSDTMGTSPFAFSPCGMAVTKVSLDGRGAAATISDRRPGAQKKTKEASGVRRPDGFVVHASVSRVARDPAPVLSVTVRTHWEGS